MKQVLSAIAGFLVAMLIVAYGLRSQHYPVVKYENGVTFYINRAVPGPFEPRMIGVDGTTEGPVVFGYEDTQYILYRRKYDQ